jgi:predicted lipid-binding transport protein (Tim44 family)
MASATLVLALFSGVAAGAGLIVYPSNGQSAQQQQQDQGQCYEWAKNQVGFDPAYGVPAAAPPPAQSSNVGMGLLGGGLLGGLIGGVTHGNMAQSVGIGMLVGGVVGHVRDEQQSSQQAQQTQYSQTVAMQQFQNAQAACLTGRGYSVRQ